MREILVLALKKLKSIKKNIHIKDHGGVQHSNLEINVPRKGMNRLVPVVHMN